MARLRDSQFGDEKVNDISHYIMKGKMWQAFENEEQAVLLIDEIDKADIEFPIIETISSFALSQSVIYILF